MIHIYIEDGAVVRVTDDHDNTLIEGTDFDVNYDGEEDEELEETE